MAHNYPEITRADIVHGSEFNPIGEHRQYTAGQINTATQLTIPGGARRVWLQPFSQNIRYTVNGTNPTTSFGFQLATGVLREIPIDIDTDIRVIAETSGASLEYQFGE